MLCLLLAMKAIRVVISRANERTNWVLRSQEGHSPGIQGSMGVSSILKRSTAGCFLLFFSCAELIVPSIGPVEARNLHPVQMTALDPIPFDPGEKDGRTVVGARTDWANLWLLSGKGADALQLDGEILRTEFFLRVPLGEDWTAGLGLPLIHASGGVLDSLIETWHSAFGLPQNLRDRLPKDDQLIQVVRKGTGNPDKLVYGLEREELELGDVPMQIHKTLFRFQGFSMGLAGGIELPTGSEERGIGNGGVDFSLGGDFSLRGTRMAGFAWVNRVWVAQAARAQIAGLPYNDIWKMGVGGQFGISSNLSFLAQLNFETSVLKALRNDHADKNQLLLWTGARYNASSRLEVDLMVGEDLITDVSPDVTIHFSLRMRL